MVEELAQEISNPPQEKQSFAVPEGTRQLLGRLFTEQKQLTKEIDQVVTTIFTMKEIVPAEPPHYDLGTGVMTYIPTASPIPIPMNRAQRRRNHV